MRLSSLLAAVAGRPGQLTHLVEPGSDPDPEITGIQLDSRRVSPGTLFCCVPGSVADGHRFAADAVAAGAAALLCEHRVGAGVTEVVVPSVREAIGALASTLHGDPSQHLSLVGVTGTNGKTTVTHLLRSVLEAAGRPCGVVGTLTGARTTPEAPDLQAALAGFVAEGKVAAAIEVSSHSLVQHRVDGSRFAVAAFTNLSQDHLDFHRTMEAYFQAKARLFEPDLAERAVVCVDDAHGRLLRDAAQVPTVGYGLGDAEDVAVGPRGTDFSWRGTAMRVGLAGRFNLVNAIGAATIAAELGVDAPAIAAGLATAPPVPGRFELVDAGQPFLVAVDYAHTPDGLVQVLSAARELAGSGRVLLVFGCGGDRDQAKRPLMGEAAGAADVVVVTSDNPRSEDPHAIIDAVLRGIPPDTDPIVQPDRRSAIAAAVGAAAPGDVVVIAGKGHETEQVLADRTVAFDDRTVAREELGR